MVFGWIKRKKEIERLKQMMRDSFFLVRQDIDKIGRWIQFLDEKDEKIEQKFNIHINELNLKIDRLEEEIKEIKEAISFFTSRLSKQLSKQLQQLSKQPTPVEGVQTGVWTAVQTGLMGNLTLTERAIVWVLLNTDMKLSYQDIATVLGKDASTIRGQINSIKQKCEGLIEEVIEKNGRKRFYIPDEIKEKVFKNVKVRVSKKQANIQNLGEISHNSLKFGKKRKKIAEEE